MGLETVRSWAISDVFDFVIGSCAERHGEADVTITQDGEPIDERLSSSSTGLVGDEDGAAVTSPSADALHIGQRRGARNLLFAERTGCRGI